MRQTYLRSTDVESAKSRWLDAFKNYELATERIAVVDSVGRVTAEPVVACMSSPHYAASAMDGYAVRSHVTVGAAPGYPLYLQVGIECFPVDTGDPLPNGTDAVIMIEHVVLAGNTIGIEQAIAPWQHVRPVGEDIVATEMLLSRYHEIGPVDVGAMLAASVAEILVIKRPHIIIMPTGDELVAPGIELRAGNIIEFNSHIFRNFLREWGCDVTVTLPVRDDESRLLQQVQESIEQCDMLLVLAGSSTGRGDFTEEVLRASGELLVHGVAMRPGKPVMLARVQGKPVVGLPGYPVSAHLCLELFVRPLVYKLRHIAEPKPKTLKGYLTRRLISPMGLQEYVRVMVGQVGAKYVVTPLSRGAGVVTSLVKADGVVVVPATSEGFAEGDQVVVTLQRDSANIEGRMVCIGSHDLALDVLADHARLKEGVRLSSTHVGSMGGILALKRGECHFAGIHLLDSRDGMYNVSFVERYFPGKQMVLVNLVGRVQGLITTKGSAGSITSWHDLTNHRFVNRQHGAGTRLLLDYHLAQNGIEASQIAGYSREETTHLAVACAVHAGEADVGLGILPAARAFDLNFVPLALEQFDLLFHKEDLVDPCMTALLDIIRSASFKDEVAALGGYDTFKSGQIVWES
ncbi:MAG: molybdopterin molybdotransferase [Bacillota bacterium]|nr:MAG: molybdopterin molybdotransferase [Bacillota bacterium]MBS3949055.1 molybdopterin biosynthesis protein [Peptococcaceae bacterium]